MKEKKDLSEENILFIGEKELEDSFRRKLILRSLNKAYRQNDDLTSLSNSSSEEIFHFEFYDYHLL